MPDQGRLALPDAADQRAAAGRTFAVLAGLLALGAILFLAFNVSREIRLLGSANSDNVQWSLAQTEVEFLEYRRHLNGEPVNLSALRRSFDVFYSRMDTISQASVFETTRADVGFSDTLRDIQLFLTASVPIIDADDADLRLQVPELIALADSIRPSVRGLATAGLDIFARESDVQREAVARTMSQLAFALSLLIGTLGLAIFYLYRLITIVSRREAQQKQTAVRLNTVIGTSLDGVIVSDARGRIIEFSPAAEVIFGHSRHDVIGRDIGQIMVPPHLRDAHDAGMERMRTTGEKHVVGKGRVKLEAQRANGDVFPIELAIQSATTDSGEIYIAFLRDISARVAAEAELVAARDRALAGEKLKTEFLATMSHEIRTPLNGILGNMDLLQNTTLTPDQARYLRHMETSGRLLLTHVSDVLDITRYDAGKLNIQRVAMNLGDLVQDIIDSQSSMAAQNGTALDWGWDGLPQVWVESDPDRLQHVLMNLVGNAVKFTRQGKVSLTVSVRTDGPGDRLRVEIEDTGPGLAADLKDRVFDDFVTGNTAYDRDVGGTGLGLAIAKRFVTALDGQIGVDSEPGQGCTFWIDIPIKRVTHHPGAVETKRSPTKIAPLDILVVEDNEINRIVVRDMLQAAGHRVTEAHDGQQGMIKAHSHAYDLILMDISMPVMDGRTATRLIRTGQGASANTRILALTANVLQDERVAFLEDGMDGVLTKPLTQAALHAALAKEDRAEKTAPRSTDVIDSQHNRETRDVLGADTYDMMRSRFDADMGALIAELTDGADDPAAVAAAAHKGAGSAAVFGAIALRETLKQIETAAKSGDTAALPGLIATLPDLHRDTIAALA
ncbi:histidine kinase [Loktanella sp. 3ANDIMAR09]|nr:histidine kinase [Loktanella sp. 3ANDIMAR09]